VTAEQVLRQILEAGGEVIPDLIHPRVLAPPALKPLVLEHRDELRELLLGQVPRRVEAFRRQLRDWTSSGRWAVPFLTMPGAPDVRDGSCGSCGATIRSDRLRCDLCGAAVEIVLRDMDKEASP
jgi:hypothetical protein